MAREKRLDRRLVERQHGLVTIGQLKAHGLNQDAVLHRVKTGRLHRVHRGVYAVGHPRLAREGVWMAAVLACGPGAVLSHESAAALWEMRRAVKLRTSDVSVRTQTGRTQRRGIRIHRLQGLEEVTTRHNIPVTTPERTVIDVACSATRRQVERVLGEGEYLRLISHDNLSLILDEGALPARARRVMRDVLDSRGIGSSTTRSELEARFLELCLNRGFATPSVNARIHGLTVDFLWREQQLIVEADGRQSHATPAAFERDRARDQRLTVAGYRVVRFTYRQVIADPAGTAQVLAALLGDGRGEA